MTARTAAGETPDGTEAETWGPPDLVVDWDVAVVMDDGVVLRADVFRPRQGQHPVLLSYGPYGKGLPFQEGYGSAWQLMTQQHPEVSAGSSNVYQNWEVADPEKWVPHGYVCVRVDSRGAGRSAGRLDHFSARETRDLYECIEWAGTQPWSTGKVGLSGVSYYAINQWLVAALQPPHLTCMCPWEGAADFYRDMSYHGGIYCTFFERWYDIQVTSVQHGRGERGPASPLTGEWVCGDVTLDEDELRANRVDFGAELRAHDLVDDYHAERSARWDQITVPFLSAGNWGGQGLHLRGNVEAFVRAKSEHKWLEIHGREHWVEYYTDYGVQLQRQFFDHYLKGVDNGWDRRPPVTLQIRTVDGFVERTEHEWPLARTRWTRHYLDAGELTLSAGPLEQCATRSYDVLGEGVTFWMPSVEQDTEITGPVSARLHVSSTTTDADIFLTLRAFAPDGSELLQVGAIDPKAPLAQGWLRASHRELDATLSTPERPYHRHDRPQPLVPGEVVALDVEIWPTSVVLPTGWRLALTVAGRDFDHGEEGARLDHFANELRGCGPFIHPDRPEEVLRGSVTLHTGGACDSSVLLPVIPSDARPGAA